VGGGDVGRAGGGDGCERDASRREGDGAAVGLGEVLQIGGGEGVVGELESAGGVGAADEGGSAEAIDALAHGADAGKGCPAVVGDGNAAMAIPSPGFGDEVEAGTGISKTLLEQGPGVAGDEVGGGGGVAVVEDGDDLGFRVAL